MFDTINKRELKDYLSKQLKILHLEAEGTIEMMEVAMVEGSIVQLELLWVQFVGDNPPCKKDLLQLNIKNAN